MNSFNKFIEARKLFENKQNEVEKLLLKNGYTNIQRSSFGSEFSKNTLTMLTAEKEGEIIKFGIKWAFNTSTENHTVSAEEYSIISANENNQMSNHYFLFKDSKNPGRYYMIKSEKLLDHYKFYNGEKGYFLYHLPDFPDVQILS